MADPVLPPPGGGAGGGRGLVAELSSLLGSVGRHVQALAALAGHETREAAAVYLWVLAAVVAAIVFAIFGYVFLLLFVAFALATLAGISWVWITLGLTVLHFLGLGGCMLFVAKRVKTPVFQETSQELKKDFAALSRHQP